MDFDDGSKLMEHSWVNGAMMNVMEKLLGEGGEWHKCRLVWSGDYADDEPGTEIEDPDGNKRGQNLYSLAERIAIKPGKEQTYRYILNHSKQEFIDKHKLKGDRWIIYPLPLYTCEGNGRGGGDFHDKYGDERIGSWARDVISMSNHIQEQKNNGWLEVSGQFKEE